MLTNVSIGITTNVIPVHSLVTLGTFTCHPGLRAGISFFI